MRLKECASVVIVRVLLLDEHEEVRIDTALKPNCAKLCGCPNSQPGTNTVNVHTIEGQSVSNPQYRSVLEI